MRDTNRKERLAALKRAAVKLFLDKGIEATTIDELTQEAQMAKGGFYRYFADKKALVVELLAPLREELLAAMKSCESELKSSKTREEMARAYQRLGERLVPIAFNQLQVVHLYLQESRGPAIGAREPVVELSREIARSAMEMTRLAHSRGLLRPMNPAVSALAVIGAVERLLVALIAGDDVGNPLRIPEELTRLVLEGLRPAS